MSEALSPPIQHRQAERKVHTDISRPKDVEHGTIGREHDPRVAEAMAYAAKPLIDEVLETLDHKASTTDEFVGWRKSEERTTDGRVIVEGVTRPAVVDTDGNITAFGELSGQIKQAHEKAGALQEQIWADEEEARAIEAKAKEQADRVRNRHL